MRLPPVYFEDPHTIVWSADLRAYALAQMPNFVPPADGAQLRVVHTLYLVGLMSALDIAKELFDEQLVEDD